MLEIKEARILGYYSFKKIILRRKSLFTFFRSLYILKIFLSTFSYCLEIDESLNFAKPKLYSRVLSSLSGNKYEKKIQLNIAILLVIIVLNRLL